MTARADGATTPAFQTATLPDGLRLRYAERGEPGGLPILFLHGWPDSWFSFSRVLPLLPRGYRALAPDQRGFGESDRPDCCYGIADLAADALAFLDAVGMARATVVGHSFGTFVARQLAAAYPERVAHLVLIGSAYSPVNRVMREVQTSLQELPDPVPRGFAREFQSSTAHVPLPADFFERIVTESIKLPARLWRAALDGLLSFDDAGELSRIAAPNLLLWGERDALFSLEDQERLVKSIRGARLTIYRDTGHCPNWERPDRVAADLTAFIQAAAPARADRVME
jgi:non-heme chloroperoxidase